MWANISSFRETFVLIETCYPVNFGMKTLDPKEKCHYKNKNMACSGGTLLYIHTLAKKMKLKGRKTCRKRWVQSRIKRKFWNSQKMLWY